MSRNVITLHSHGNILTLSDTDEAPIPTQLTEMGLDEETLEVSLALHGDWKTFQLLDSIDTCISSW